MTQEYNVLLFGETGAGKSTFINACDVYLKYENLSNALDAKRIYVRIPFKFISSDEGYVEHEVEFGSDVNENANAKGESATLGLMVHTFGYQGNSFHFIDTPGFGDTKGCVADSENAKRIVESLKKRFSRLHAVCFILKAGQNRDDITFKYNVKQMLSLLHKDMLKNVMLIYTHSSGDNFKSGSAHSVFKKVLEDTGVEIGWDNKRFFVDNKCFNYVLAVDLEKDTADSDDRDTHSFCWSKTRTSYLKIFHHIQTLEPRSIDEMKQVYDLRTRFEDLFCRELTEIETRIKQRETKLEEIKSTVKKCEESIERYQRNLYNRININLREGPPYYHLICKNSNCKMDGVYGEDGKACCLHCTALVKTWCSIFDSSYYCKACGCSSDRHDYIHRQVFEEKERVKNPEIASLLKGSKDKLVTERQSHGSVLEQLRLDQTELLQIQLNINNKIAILKRYCFVPYSKECIEQINMEMNKRRVKGESTKELENYLNRYEQLYGRCLEE